MLFHEMSGLKKAMPNFKRKLLAPIHCFREATRRDNVVYRKIETVAAKINVGNQWNGTMNTTGNQKVSFRLVWLMPITVYSENLR